MTISGFGFGAENVIVTVGGIQAQVVQATGHAVTFIVPASASYGPTIVEIRHRKGSQEGSIGFQVGCGQNNQLPVANAGQDQDVLVGDLVGLDGRSSFDPDGDPLTYEWQVLSKPDGSNAALSDPTAMPPTFMADLPGLYMVQLIVSDGRLDSVPDTASITAQVAPPVNHAPVAVDDPALTGQNTPVLIAVLGNDFDPDGDPISVTGVTQGGAAQ